MLIAKTQPDLSRPHIKKAVGAFLLICVLAGFSASAHAQAAPPAKNDSVPPQTAMRAYSATYVRPGFRQRLQSYVFDTFGPVRLSRDVFGAAISHADDVPPDWGQGWGPYGERVASHLGASIFDGGANLLLGEALREDTNYYPCKCQGIWPRLKHALMSSITARAGEDGHRVFSIPGVASPYAGAFAQLAWYPPRFGPKDAFRSGNYELLDAAGAKVALEFVSPLLRKLRWR